MNQSITSSASLTTPLLRLVSIGLFTAMILLSTHAAAAEAVPAGTTLMVRTVEGIDTMNNKAGSRFTAKLEGKLMAGDKEIAPVGANVYGRVVKSERGGIGARGAALEIELTQIQIDGQLKPISTNLLVGTGDGGEGGKKVLKGAIVGGLADGSSGARTGARIGAGAAVLSGGKHAGIPSGTLLEFSLSAPFSP